MVDIRFKFLPVRDKKAIQIAKNVKIKIENEIMLMK